MLISIFTIFFNNLRRFYLKISTLKDRYLGLKNLIGAILLISILNTGCQKESQSLGVNLMPGVKEIETRFHQDKDISAYTFTDDSIRVDRPRYNMIGSFNDPLFGYTSGYFAAQFRLPYNPKYEADAALDSVILQMSYKYVYGDTLTTQTILVHQLDGDIHYDNPYLSTFNLKNLANPNVIGSVDFIPKFRTDSTKRDTTAQILRVPLNSVFGDSLLKMNPAHMVDNDVFIRKFKGLLIETAPVSRKGSLIKVDAPSAYIVVYYHTAAHDSLGFGYRLSANSAAVSGYVHDYSTSKFFANLNNESATNNDTLAYLQPTGGTKVKINIPGLTTWKDSANYAINKATLTIRVDTLMTDFKHYQIPPQLYLKIVDNGKEVFPKDGLISLSYYGGYFNPLTGTYTFNITQYLQQIISGEKQNSSFYLVHPERNTSPKRVVLKSGKSAGKLDLDVTYTRYK